MSARPGLSAGAGALALAGLLGLSGLLGGCAAPAEPRAMAAVAAPAAATAGRQHPYSVAVQVQGGQETGGLDSSNIANADLRQAIEESIRASRLFQAVVAGRDGDYLLSVNVIQLSKPLFGGTVTVEFEAGWSLTRASDRQVVLRQVVKSSGTAAMAEAFAFVTRLRLAVEAAARDNIRQGLAAVAVLAL